MKKLVVMAAIVCASIAAKAAISFSVYGLDSKYEGYTISHADLLFSTKDLDQTSIQGFYEYLLDPNLLVACKEYGITTWEQYYSLYAQTQPSAIVADGRASYVASKVVNPYGKYSVSFLLLEDGLVPGGNYEILSTAYYDDTKTLDPDFDLSTATVIDSGKLNVDEVPEPTSGLLMLLGMAGLALRRRCA